MAENEAFMDAIREDVMLGDEQAAAEEEEEAYQRELEKIQRGEYSPNEGGEISADLGKHRLDRVSEELTSGSQQKLVPIVGNSAAKGKVANQFDDDDYEDQADDDYEF